MLLYCCIKGVSFAVDDFANYFLFMRKLSMDELNRLDTDGFKNSEKIPVVAVLDNLRSLHNVGSFFRTADAFRLQKMLLCGFTGTPPHREIHRAALGAEQTVAWQHVDNTREALENLKADGYITVAIEQTSISCPLQEFVFEPGKSYALVFGNEVDGVSDEALAACDAAIEIPQAGTKHSLNVSVCGGIMMWECFKQLTYRH
jgi:23S rRNA (guanosine2251-2'-O)-methyltransferase